MKNSGNKAAPDRRVTIDGRTIDLAVLEKTLRSGSAVEECVVLSRVDTDGLSSLVAYVVPTAPYAPIHLDTHVRTNMPWDEVRCSYVPISRVPLTETGEVDVETLCQLPVIDDVQLRRWDERIRALAETGEAAIVVQERGSHHGPLHFSDLIPEWKSAIKEATAAPWTAQNPGVSVEARQSGALAVADGGPLLIPENAPRTLTEALLRTAREYPHKGIVHVKANGEEFFQSYPTLLHEALCILAGLHTRGLKPGAKVILQLESLSDHFSSFWACVLGGITPVTVAVSPSYAEQNSVVNKLHNVWKLLDCPIILASERLVQPLVELERFFPSETFQVASVDSLKRNLPAQNIYDSKPEDLVFLQLTSGSTGTPKCIQESHRSIIAHIHGSREFNGYEPDDICLNWLPVDHVVPILTIHLKDVYLGCQEIQVETALILSNSLRWLDLIDTHRVTHTWSPNFGFKLLSDRLASAEGRKWDLSSVKFFMNAGEQVTLPVVWDFLKRVAPFGVPPRAMQPAFGMAEVCTCMTYQNGFGLTTGVHRILKSSLSGRLQLSNTEDPSTVTFVDLGPPMPGVQIRITDTRNQVLPEGVIGRLQIQGDVLTLGYLHNEEANREGFVGEGWFNSGDLGFILNGRLTLTGREKEIIIVRGCNIYCFEIEDVVNGIPGVEPTFAGCCAVSDPSTGTEGLAIFFVPQKAGTDEKIRLMQQIRSEVGSKLGIAPSLVIPLSKNQFPKTTSGKIQRSQLKESLSAGVYDPIRKEIDAALANANTVPDWFYRRIWRRKEIMAHGPSHLDAGSLIFADVLGLGDCLFEKLKEHQPCVRVHGGAEFVKLNAQSYRIDPSNPEHYQRLFDSIAADGAKVSQILHLWTYRQYDHCWDELENVELSLDAGVFSLLFLVQALSKRPASERPSRLQVVSSNSQHTKNGDLVDSTRSLVLGLLRTVPREIPWLACSHVDTPGRNIEEETGVVLKEMESLDGDHEAAWRDGHRWVPQLEKVDFRTERRNRLPFKLGGFYLLSGGLGGVGVELAKHLLKDYQARLLILGRTPLPERKAWNDHLDKCDVVGERIRAYQQLESFGEIAYEAVDICDLGAVQSAVVRAEARWGAELAGVIHLAGLYRECLLDKETRESFAAVLRPKVLGSLVLHQLVKGRSGALFLSFSSVNGLFGGFLVSAYSAANAFLISFADYQRETLPLLSYCLAWTQWEETGMSRGLAMKELARSRGYHNILREMGINSFRAAVLCDGFPMLIGLDPTKQFIRRYLEDDCCALQELTAYLVTANNSKASLKLEELSLADRYGTPTKCRIELVDELPRTAAQVDQKQLSTEGHAAKDSEPPQTAVEEALAVIWAEILGVQHVGRNDNFFILGGHSLSAVQITFKIQRRFKVDFPLRTFMEAPVLRMQAERLEEKLLEQADASAVEKLINEMEHAPENRR